MPRIVGLPFSGEKMARYYPHLRWLRIGLIGLGLSCVAMAVLRHALMPFAVTLIVLCLGLLVLSFRVKLPITKRQRLEAWAMQRSDWSVIDFSRSFDTRWVNTWVIRSVYEELQKCIAQEHSESSVLSSGFPIHADDHLEYFSLFEENRLTQLKQHLLQKIDRFEPIEFEKTEIHPTTVGDLVFWLNDLPKNRDI